MPKILIQVAFGIIVATASLLHVLATQAYQPNESLDEVHSNRLGETAGFVSTNPGGGGALNSPVVTSDGKWIVGSDLGGLYLSADNGLTWQAVGAAQGLLTSHVASLSAMSNNSVAIGAEGGVFILDTSTSVVQHAWPANANNSFYVSAITATANPSVLYAAAHDRFDALSPVVLRSNDGGDSWFEVSGTLPSTLRAVGMRAHPSDANIVWLLSGEGRFAGGPAHVYISVDGGAKFSRRANTLGDIVDINYAHDSVAPSRMYASVQQDLLTSFYSSSNNGLSWSAVTQFTNIGDAVRCGNSVDGLILPDQSFANHVRLFDVEASNSINNSGKHSVLWESWDGGISFTCSTFPVSVGWSQSTPVWGIGASYQGTQQSVGYSIEYPDVVLLANRQFVFKSLDGGFNWQDAVSKQIGSSWQSRGLDNVVPVVVAPSAANSDLVYAGYMDMGLWRSDDGGNSWIDLNTIEFSENWLGFGGNTLSVVADPARESVVWAQVAGDLEDCVGPLDCNQPLHLLKSIDKGASWTELGNGLPAEIWRLEGLSVAPDSAINQRWLYVVANGDVYLSQNDGLSWTNVLDCNQCHRTWYVEGLGVFAMSPSQLFISYQGGTSGTWQTVNLSVDITNGLTPNFHWLHDLYEYVGLFDAAFDAANDTIWLAVYGSGKGLYRSNDAGVTWAKVLNDEFARAVRFDANSGEVLFGSSSALSSGGYSPASNGLLISSNGSTNWQEANAGLVYPFVTGISIGENGKRWLISPGQGIMHQSDEVDTDADGIVDSIDNCVLITNANQRDTDADNIGNACDPDFNQDCMVNFVDLSIFSSNFLVGGDLDTDINGDGVTNFLDFSVMTMFFLSAPGPAALPNSCSGR